MRNRTKKETFEWICYLTILNKPLPRMEICGVYVPRTAVGLVSSSARHVVWSSLVSFHHCLNVVTLTIRIAAAAKPKLPMRSDSESETKVLAALALELGIVCRRCT